jgi:tRNA A-37 threonylcarbamoyl transferase component Bud32
MGQVYLAHDTRLDRAVALKVVRRELIDSRESLDRFMTEARTTARFNHPHIVTIYAVGDTAVRGSDKRAPYVAMAYLEGENLRERLLGASGVVEPLGLRDALAVGIAVAEALAEAHRHGVCHRDLKPANVIVSPDGGVRVVDFGLALHQPHSSGEYPRADAADDPALLEDGGPGWGEGTPAYMAPEQWQGCAAVPASDVWALGVILFEMCAGLRPFTGLSHGELATAVCGPDPAPDLATVASVPAPLATLVERCLQKRPSQRPQARVCADVLRSMMRAETRRHDDGPYRGFCPFAERHADLFFGREVETAALVRRLEQSDPTVLVVGPSGCGKTSLVQAGVLPALRRRGNWCIFQMRPGSRPLRSLAACVLGTGPSVATVSEGRVAPTDVELLGRRLAREPDLLGAELRAIAVQRASHVLFVVDELEQLWALCDDRAARRAFLEAVCRAAVEPAEPVRILLAARDSLPDGADGPAAFVALSARAEALGSLGRGELERALVEPARAVGLRYDDPALPAEVAHALETAPGGLALAQYVAQLLGDQRDRGQGILPRWFLGRLGGVEGAIAEHADAVVDSLAASELALARRMLCRLCARAARDAGASGAGSTALSLGELFAGLAPPGRPERLEADRVLARLVDARLLVLARGRVMLAHAALGRSWATMVRWLRQPTSQAVDESCR